MSLRDERQEEFANKYINRPAKNFKGLSLRGGGILYLCPRFGKCRVAIDIMKKKKADKILIAYPDNKIKKSWEEEFRILGYNNPNVVFSTHLSLHKHIGDYDLVVIDEIHLLSEAQIEAVQELTGNEILGLTGTMTEWTEKTLSKRLGLNVIERYSIETAIEEGVVTDYRIYIKYCKLDDSIKQNFKNKLRTEKKQFDSYSYLISKFQKEMKDTFYLRLGRMRVIQNSIAKLKATQDLLKRFKDDRVLVFCGVTSIADRVGCPVYHSKKGDKQVFDEFSAGKGNHMAVIKIGNTGVTYKPLDKVIVNYFDSNAENLAQKINRCMAMEYGNPNKRAEIYIVTTDEPVEQMWLGKALEFFDGNKIKLIS